MKAVSYVNTNLGLYAVRGKNWKLISSTMLWFAPSAILTGLKPVSLKLGDLYWWDGDNVVHRLPVSNCTKRGELILSLLRGGADISVNRSSATLLFGYVKQCLKKCKIKPKKRGEA